MKKNIIKIVVLAGLFFPASLLSAQGVVPFVAQSLSKEAVSGAFSGAVFSTAMKSALLPVTFQLSSPAILTASGALSTPAALSDMEKTLWQKPKSLGAQIGLANVLFDQNAVLFQVLQAQRSTTVSVDVFAAHQQGLANAVFAMEQTLVTPAGFESWKEILKGKINCGADYKVIQGFFEGVPQPLFPVLSKTEIDVFANLPTLETQIAYVEDSIALIEEQLGHTLSQDISTLSPDMLETYYLQKVRLDYFQKMQKILQGSSQKKQSLIIRSRTHIHDGMRLMTDAEHLGYLRYQADTQLYPSFANTTLEDRLTRQITQRQLDKEFTQADKLYGIYARAEVFGVPYEYFFTHPEPSLALVKDAQYLETIPKVDKIVELEHRLDRVQNQLSNMRLLKPTGASFYKEYYRLCELENIYEREIMQLTWF